MTRFAALLVLLSSTACSTTLVDIVSGDAGPEHDAANDAPPVYVDSGLPGNPYGDASADTSSGDDAADAGAPDTSSAPDSAPPFCFGDSPTGWTAAGPNCVAIAANSGCPACAAYGYQCLSAKTYPIALSVDAGRIVETDAGTPTFCSASAICVRAQQFDNHCTVAKPTALNCAPNEDGGLAASVPASCVVVDNGDSVRGPVVCCP